MKALLVRRTIPASASVNQGTTGRVQPSRPPIWQPNRGIKRAFYRPKRRSLLPIKYNELSIFYNAVFGETECLSARDFFTWHVPLVASTCRPCTVAAGSGPRSLSQQPLTR